MVFTNYLLIEGHVMNGRVEGNLSVSRTLGDFYMEPYVTCKPDSFYEEVEEGDLILICCDGVWDEIEDEEAIQFVLSSLETDNSLFKAATFLRDAAYQMGSTDNISVILLQRCE